MTKLYELANGHRICTDYDESKKEVTLNAIAFDSIIRDLNRYADKKGEWLPRPDGRFIYAQCSECGEIHDVASNYCPSCGCLMDRNDFNKYLKERDSE
jgi:hypothetical protein